MGKMTGRSIDVPSNIYTVIIAFAFVAVLATVTYVIYKCYFQYGIIFKTP